jgi:hypothetical protein
MYACLPDNYVANRIIANLISGRPPPADFNRTAF